MTNRTFSPVVNGRGLTPHEYIEKYPELSERDETRKLSGVELMWCWYYGHPDSTFFLLDPLEKAKKVTYLVFDKINKGYYEQTKIDLLKLNRYPDTWYEAIDFFKNVNTDARAEAKRMVQTIFNEFNTIIKEGITQFRGNDGIPDVNKFVAAMKVIKEQLPDLINTLERGFAVTEYDGTTDQNEEGQYWCEIYLKNKR